MKGGVKGRRLVDWHEGLTINEWRYFMKYIFGTRMSLLAIVILCGVFVFAGCTSKDNESESVDGEPTPITLKVHFGEDENFIDSFIKPAEDAFPHITFEHVEGEYEDRKSTRLNSSHVASSYAVFCLKKKKSRSSK